VCGAEGANLEVYLTPFLIRLSHNGAYCSTGSFHLYEKGEHNHAIGRIRPVVEQELKDVKPTAAEISTPILQPLQSINNCNTLPTSGVYNYLQTFSTLAELEFYRADKTLYSAIVSAAGNKRTYSCPVTVCPESGEKCPYALVAFRNAKNFVCYERGEHRHPKNGANTLSVMRNADVKEEIEDVGPEIAVERVVKEEMMEVTKDEVDNKLMFNRKRAQAEYFRPSSCGIAFLPTICTSRLSPLLLKWKL